MSKNKELNLRFVQYMVPVEETSRRSRGWFSKAESYTNHEPSEPKLQYQTEDGEWVDVYTTYEYVPSLKEAVVKKVD